jgi:hypothetical protein
MNLIASENASATHPGKSSRLSSIEDGWETADGQMSGSDVATTSSQQAVQTVEQHAADKPVQTRGGTTQYPTTIRRVNRFDSFANCYQYPRTSITQTPIK